MIICELAQHFIEPQVCEHVLQEEFILPLTQLLKGPLSTEDEGDANEMLPESQSIFLKCENKIVTCIL